MERLYPQSSGPEPRAVFMVEHVEGEPAVLSSLSSSVVRTFLAYVRDPQPNGRWGTEYHATQRETRPSTVHTYYRALRAFSNFCMEEGLVTTLRCGT
jgi:hypothetical protein